MKKSLEERFRSKGARIGVIGQGYVGLPLALAFAESGFETVGVDVDPERVGRLGEGRSYLKDVDDERIASVVDDGRYRATEDYAALAEVDAVAICVPTPLRKTRDPDISFIRSAAERMVEYLQPPCLVILESTTYPGTTEEVVLPLLLDENGDLAEGYFLAFSPERIDPGNEHWNVYNTPKVVGGVDETSTRLTEVLYSQFIDEVHPVETATHAEMVKLLENTFRAVNIGFVNDLTILCDRMGLDVWQVIEAAGTKPFGFMSFYPGPGVGGHCIPNDPTYLSWKAKSFDFYSGFIELASDVNANMPRFTVQKLTRLLNEQEKPVKNSDILILGMAYKPDVDDIRESPALEVWEILSELGANLSYHDPYIDEVDELGGAESVELDSARVAASDAVIICTDHSSTDWQMVGEQAQLVLDTRNCITGEYPDVYKL